jgi:hypothetical protein
MANVRFGSKADMCSAQADVRFVPIADIRASKAVIALAMESVSTSPRQ